MRAREKILVIKLSALGDFVQSFGPMKAIRDYHPNAEIHLLTTKPYVTLGERSNYFDRVIIDKRPKLLQLHKWLALRQQLNDGHYTRVYDLQNNDRTGIYYKLMHPKPEWVGIAKGASHRNTAPDRKAGLAFYGHVQTLALAGITDIKIDRMEWMGGDLSTFNLNKPYALIVPGCAPTRPEKRWPATHYAALCQAISAKNIQPVLLGTKDEKEITDYIADHCDGVLNLSCQTSLFDIPALGRGAQFAVGNDTGPMHMIGPTGCQSLVLFSKNSEPHRHKPLGENVQTIQVDDLENLHPDQVIKAIQF